MSEYYDRASGPPRRVDGPGCTPAAVDGQEHEQLLDGQEHEDELDAGDLVQPVKGWGLYLIHKQASAGARDGPAHTRAAPPPEAGPEATDGPRRPGLLLRLVCRPPYGPVRRVHGRL